MKFLPLPVVVFILFVVAAGLGLLIYNQQQRQNFQKNTIQTPKTSESVGSQEQQQSQENGEELPPLTAEEQELLTPPSTNLSLEQRARRDSLFSKYAKRGDTITISEGCRAIPIVLKVNVGSKATVFNQDSIGHSITLSKDEKYDLKKEGTITLDTSKTAVNHITCDGQGVAGYLLVIP
jgi:hypothetical protein